MTLTLRPVPTKYSFALEQARSETHRKLKHEMEEIAKAQMRMGRPLSEYESDRRQRRSTPHYLRD